jgi:hypothetical protein
VSRDRSSQPEKSGLWRAQQEKSGHSAASFLFNEQFRDDGQMTVLIDQPIWPAHDMLWAHIVSDSSLDELHAFAERAGIPRRAFDHDHYDVPERKWDELVAMGAEPVGVRELVERLQASGLRVSQRQRRGL